MQERVLIVDDERSLRRTLTFVFRRAGCEVREAGDGDAALELLREQPADLIVLDIMMPVRNGLDTLREIRSDPALRQGRVIMLTAKGQTEDRKLAFELGTDEFMTKPFSPLEVRALGEKLLAEGPHPVGA